ncbi:tRNA pseudouridine(38-40) synthase TruA [candidate division KSB1 bacterium]|nr:tRNA pseudouridine(38-40) synthase TruA [candidate division KSB1 bacterium]
MRKIKLVIEYDGTDFCGWQSQPGVRTVQDVLEKVLFLLTQESIRTISAGRTDSGVHARGQVVHFVTEKSMHPEVFQRGGNAYLPSDIRILDAEEVDERFHARYSAKKRTYSYTICFKPKAISRQYAWFVPYPLEVQKMCRACSVILGEHNFKSFCKANSPVINHVCHIYHAEWKAIADGSIFVITANRFLHNMVRILVSAFVELGKNRFTMRNFRDVIEAMDRTCAPATAPPYGLVLEKVEY